jgi:hypothetical protein
MYDLLRKFGVGQTYLRLWGLSSPVVPTALELARESKVGWEYAAKVIAEILHHNEIIDGDEMHLSQKTPSFSPFVLKYPIAPTWIIVASF